MKKILTLMAAMAAATGGAYAHDYNWNFQANGLENATLSGQQGVTATVEGLSFNTEDGNSYIEFKAQPGDVINYKASGANGSAIYVSTGNRLNKIQIEDKANLKTTISTSETGEVVVRVWASQGAKITNITVSSAATAKVVEEIEKVQEEYNRSLERISDYARIEGKFYTLVKKLYNEQGTEIENIIKELAEREAANTVSNPAAGETETGSKLLIEKLQGISEKVAATGENAIFVKSEAFKSKYNAIVEQTNGKVEEAAEEIAAREKHETADAKALYKDDGTEKWVGVDAAFKTYVKGDKDDANCNSESFWGLIHNAWRPLEKFDDATDLDAYPDKFEQIATWSKNIQDRFTFENENTLDQQATNNVNAFARLVAAIEEMVTFSTGKTEMFKQYDLTNSTDGARKLANKYKTEIESTTNKHTIPDPATKFSGCYNSVVSKIETVKNAWGQAVEDKLSPIAKEIRETIDKDLYLLSAQYGAESPEMQTIEKAYAGFQNTLKDIEKQYTDRGTAEKAYAVAKAYNGENGLLAQMNALKTNVENEFNTLQNGQNTVIITKNQTEFNKITANVTAARAYYSNAVEKLTKYRDNDFFKNNVSDYQEFKNTLDKDIKSIYDNSTIIENSYTAAKTELSNCNKSLEGNKIVSKLADFTTFNTDIASAVTEIETAMKHGINLANNSAYYYYTHNAEGTSTEADDCQFALAEAYVGVKENACDEIKDNNTLINTETAFSDAMARLTAIKTGTYELAEDSDIKSARSKASSLYANLLLADDVTGDKTVDAIITAAKGAADKVVTDLTTYAELSNKTFSAKVRWSETNAKVITAASDDLKTFLENKYHAAIKELTEQLTVTDKLEASGKVAYYNNEFAKIDSLDFKANNFDLCVRNEAAYKELTAMLPNVQTAIDNAKNTTADKQEAKDVLEQAITKAEADLAGVKTKIEDSYAYNGSHDIDAKKAEYKAEIEKIESDLATAVKAAQNADITSSADIDGDGTVTSRDLDLAKEKVYNEESIFEGDSRPVMDQYNVFIEYYLKDTK